MKLNFIFLIEAGTLAGMITAVIVFLPLLFMLVSYLFLAQNDILFTFSKENRVKYIMEANGKQFTGKTILSSKKYYIDPNTYDIEEITSVTPKEYYKKWNFFGMYWVGFPPFRSIYHYHMIWQQWKLKSRNPGEEPKNELWLRDEMTPYLFIKRTEYGMFLEKAENAEGYALDVKFAVYLRAVNARKPMFDVDNAFGQLQSLILGAAARFVHTKTFTTLHSSKKTIEEEVDENDEFSKFLSTLNETIDGDGVGLKEKIGYIIEGASIITVEIAGEAKEKITQATIEVALAEQRKQAAILDAEGKKAAMDLETEAKAERYKLFNGNPEATAIEIAEKTFSGNGSLTTYAPGRDSTTTIPLR